MGGTPDRFPGPSQEEELELEDNGVDPSVVGGVTFNAGAFRMRDALGTFNPRSGAASIFGEAYTAAESEPQSDTTSSSFQPKVTLTTPAVNAGTYLVLWSAEVRSSVGSKTEELRLLLDGVTTLALPAVTHGDKDVWTGVGGTKPLALTAGVHTVALQFRLAGNAATVSIRRARLEIWRTT